MARNLIQASSTDIQDASVVITWEDKGFTHEIRGRMRNGTLSLDQDFEEYYDDYDYPSRTFQTGQRCYLEFEREENGTYMRMKSKKKFPQDVAVYVPALTSANIERARAQAGAGADDLMTVDQDANGFKLTFRGQP